MKEGNDVDRVELALVEMGRYDAAEAAIERAEAAGAVVEVPQLDAETVDAIVAASLRAAMAHPEASTRTRSTARRWTPWALSGVAAAAAALVLWLGGDRGAAEVGPVPAAELRLGGTARSLGEAPPVRAYGPGDTFFAELSFDAPPRGSIVADVFARDARGELVHLDLARHDVAGVVRFEGELAGALDRGVWTLEVRYGWSSSCVVSTAEGCERRETRVEVVGP